MRYYEMLAEALKFSQIRPYMKDWDRERYGDIFKNPKFKHDKNGYRVFFPIETRISDNTEKSPTHIEIEKFLNENGFEIVDYIKGIVRNTEKNQNIKIGKVLNKLKATDLLNAFNVDKTREGTKSEYIVVISRHPYDIAGMSTDRGWTSCMNLDTGMMRHYVPIDIKEGSVVAYVTKVNDPDLKNPTGRLLIKPFVDVLGSPNVQFGIEERIYGTDVPGFIDTVKRWVDAVNDSQILNDVAIFKFNNKLYADSGLATQTIIKGTKLTQDEKQQIELLTEYPSDIFNIENPSDALRIVAITSNRGFGIFREMLKYEDYIPSFKVQLAGVTKDYGDIIPLMHEMYPDHSIDLKIYSTALNGMVNDNDIAYNSSRVLSEFAAMLITYEIKLPSEQISKILNKAPKFLGGFIKQGYDFDNDYILNLVKNSEYPESIYTSLIKNDIQFGNDVDLEVINNDRTRITTQTMNKIIQINLEKQNKVPEKIKDAILNRTPEMILSFLRNREKYAVNISNDEIVNCIISENMPEDEFTYVVSRLFDEFEIKFDENQIEKLIWEIKDSTYLNYILRMLNTYNLMTDDIARIALKRTYIALEFIDEKTAEDYKHALRRGFGALDFIENPLYEQIEYAIKRTYEDEFTYNSFETYDKAFDRSQLSDEEKTQLLYYLVKKVPDSIVGIIKNHEKYNLPKATQRAAINGGSGSEMIQAMYNHGFEPEDDILIKFLDEPQLFDSLGNSGFLMRFVNNYKEKNRNYTLSDKVLDKIFEKNADVVIGNILRNDMKIPIGNKRLKKYLSDSDNHLDFNKFRNFMKNYKNYNIEITPEILKLLLEYDRGSDDHNFQVLNLKLFSLNEDHDDILTDDMYKIILDKNRHYINIIKNPSKELTDYAAKLEPTKKLSVGDMVRATNPKAKPKYKIEEITENGYVLSLDGEIKGEFPKERIHRVNGIDTE